MDVIPIGFYRIIRVYHIVLHVAKTMQFKLDPF